MLDRPIAYWQIDYPSVTTTKRYIHADQQNRPYSVWSWTTATAILWSFRPDIYGWDGYIFTPTIFQPLGFPGQYRDDETKALNYLWGIVLEEARPALFENRHRYYDPFNGAYMQVDPLVDSTWEAYNYAGQNPVMRTDPTGGRYLASKVGSRLLEADRLGTTAEAQHCPQNISKTRVYEVPVSECVFTPFGQTGVVYDPDEPSRKPTAPRPGRVLETMAGSSVGLPETMASGRFCLPENLITESSQVTCFTVCGGCFEWHCSGTAPGYDFDVYGESKRFVDENSPIDFSDTSCGDDGGGGGPWRNMTIRYRPSTAVSPTRLFTASHGLCIPRRELACGVIGLTTALLACGGGGERECIATTVLVPGEGLLTTPEELDRSACVPGSFASFDPTGTWAIYAQGNDGEGSYLRSLRITETCEEGVEVSSSPGAFPHRSSNEDGVFWWTVNQLGTGFRYDAGTFCNVDREGNMLGVLESCDVLADDPDCRSTQIEARPHGWPPGESEAEGLELVSELLGGGWPPALTSEVSVHDGIAYLARSEDGIRVMRVSDPQNPVEIAHVLGTGESINEAKAITSAMGEPFLLAASDATGLIVLDISDPSAPTEVARYHRNRSAGGPWRPQR